MHVSHRCTCHGYVSHGRVPHRRVSLECVPCSEKVSKGLLNDRDTAETKVAALHPERCQSSLSTLDIGVSTRLVTRYYFVAYLL
jgi:hypothetical protein